uniref:Ras-related GTP-binding protein n=1 Tax=Oncorhynchus kisutch TaxID=8019 RepID=A0A8C7LEN1_ONCKI
ASNLLYETSENLPPPLRDEEALSRLHLTITRAYKVNPDIIFEVFIHKVDRLSDDNSGIEKAFLFDVVSKIYIASDSLVDMQTYELCCDMIDISCIYRCCEGFHKRVMNALCIPPLSVTRLSPTGLIDCNFLCFKNAFQEVFDVQAKMQENRKLLSQRRWSKLTENTQ